MKASRGIHHGIPRLRRYLPMGEDPQKGPKPPILGSKKGVIPEYVLK